MSSLGGAAGATGSQATGRLNTEARGRSTADAGAVRRRLTATDQDDGIAHETGDIAARTGGNRSPARCRVKGGDMTKKVLGSTALLLVLAGALGAAGAYGSPKLWTDSSETTLLRSVKAIPVNQPDALEFVNEGPVGLLLFAKGFIRPITCNELEYGTTVLANNELVGTEVETKLALPFGVAEGDECTTLNSAGLSEPVPIYFDTNASGAVPANITLTGPAFEATVHKLKLSEDIEGKFCTALLEGVKGAVSNATSGFVEESPSNLTVTIAAMVPITCGKEKVKEEIKARFFVETMSTTTDTAFIGP